MSMSAKCLINLGDYIDIEEFAMFETPMDPAIANRLNDIILHAMIFQHGSKNDGEYSLVISKKTRPSRYLCIRSGIISLACKSGRSWTCLKASGV